MEEFLFFLSFITLIICWVVLKRTGNLKSQLLYFERLYEKRSSEIIALLKSQEGSQGDKAERVTPIENAEDQAKEPVSPAFVETDDVAEVDLAEGDGEDDFVKGDKEPSEFLPGKEGWVKATPWVHGEKLTSVRQELSAEALAEKRLKLEQWIGTRGVLAAGIVTSIIGMIFFLKYMSDRGYIGPAGRVVIAALVGFAALGVGEVTRRRDYGIVARGLTALGFAILYVAVFGAYGYYEILDIVPAFGMSILITIGAMSYAVGLNDVLAGFVALLGGYLSPVLLSTGENRPVALFSYVSILSAGAMLCAYYRRWRPVNVLAFLGSFVLYAMWFEKFYRPTINSVSMPGQLPVAIIGLGLFFVIFLILPVLHELVRKVRSHREDVTLVMINAMVVLYYFCAILYGHYRKSLAIASLGLCLAHLIMMAMVHRRCKEDTPLKVALLGLGLFFVTLAIPLYFKLYVVAIAWAGEAVLLTLIGLRYGSLWTRACGIIAIMLGCLWLVLRLPLHEEAFRFVINRPFFSWAFVAGSMYVCHGLYRRTTLIKRQEARQLCHILFGLSFVTLLTACVMEWYWHVDYNLTPPTQYYHYFYKGLLVILTVFMLVCVIRPVSPGEIYWSVTAAGFAIFGLAFMAVGYSEFHNTRYLIFINGSFAVSLGMVLGVFAVVYLLRKNRQAIPKNREIAYWLAIGATAVLWVLLTEEIHYYWKCLGLGQAADKIGRTSFLGQMCISVMWALYAAALMVVGFWRKVALLRYMALGLFGVTLIKVFVFDLERLENIYRIAGFLVLSIALVGTSFLYQFGKKKGYLSKITP